MRIVGGKFRGKKLIPPTGDSIRPTSDRAREALFNILTHGKFSQGRALPDGANVLDVFAGSGALGLEAWSRGAASVTFLENDRAALQLIEKNLAGFKERHGLFLSPRDATRPGKPPAGLLFDLVLMDPPYSSGFAMVTAAALKENSWLAENALLVIEIGRKEEVDAPSGFSISGERTYGKSRLLFLQPNWGFPL